ncbi:hypothetical protein NHQ30_007447 [Ciborinia camelliae]|nr:hypothetical protein NHQ30_007447 [Ciborinia camelliae]
MQFTNALISAITIAAASAAAIEKRSVVFKVTDLTASCIPHSSQCLYAFNVTQAGTMETVGVSCSALVTGKADGTLPDMEKYSGECEDSSRTFWFANTTTGLDFAVSQPISPSSNLTGSFLLPAKDFISTNSGTGSYETYKGPSSVNLS